MSIRVVRLLEYTYPDAETMVSDMKKWGVRGAYEFGKITINETHLPPTISEQSGWNPSEKPDLPWPPEKIRMWSCGEAVKVDELRSEMIQWIDRLA